jgi:hypothetical protein
MLCRRGLFLFFLSHLNRALLSQITEKRTLWGFNHGASNRGKKWVREKILYFEGTEKSQK